ncbi:MAG: class I SAM-dependent methyltransferase, partial [Mariprofundaceae bacterium]|nr:class I SAM-dependent methyltransferase [Mariprofundaceae bacterium]
MNNITLVSKLDRFLADLPLDEWAGQLSAEAQADIADTRDFLLTYVNEMRVSFRLIEAEIAKEQRILEVGSGLCLLSFFLNKEGYNIVALEPALGGFELFEAAKKVISGHFSSIPLEILECTAQQLDPAAHGRFDLIFSNNVLEHIPA